jgi:hypothetical protein
MNPSLLLTFPDDKVRALTGMTPLALSELLNKVAPALLKRRQEARQKQPNRRRGTGGGRKRRLSTEQEILLALVYLRHNIAHAVVGLLFGVSADTSENTFAEVVITLRDVCPSSKFEAEKTWRKGSPSWHPDAIDKVIVDSFETPVPRPSDYEAQGRVYSGKKKRHTLKTQVATDGTGEILEARGGYRGPESDKRIYEKSGASRRYKSAKKQADLGYKGIEGIATPHKKPRGGELTADQKKDNRVFAASRVRVEHGIRRIKGFRVVRDEFRLGFGLFGTVLSGVVGLEQLNRLYP